MRFQVMSDLHIEIEDGNPDVLSYITPQAEILILAGDMGRIHKFIQLKTFLKDLCKHFQFVLYVLGNHEYYKVTNIPVKSMDDLLVDLRDIQKEIPNLHVLNRTSVVIENVCVIGCTLWSQATVDVPPFIVRVRDMSMARYNLLHKQDLSYIEQMIEYTQKNRLKLVVVTHHCPTYLVTQKKRGDKYRSLYASNLDHLLSRDKVNTWICGHVHTNFDFYTKNGTRLLSNQKGKPKDGITDYSKAKVLSL